MTKVIVHQYVYVAHDKTRSFVTIIDLNTGEELAHKHYVSGGIPLFEVATDLFNYVIETLISEIEPDEIQYRCNVLGGFNLLMKKNGEYKRINVYNRFERSKSGRLVLESSFKKLEEYNEDEMEEEYDYVY